MYWCVEEWILGGTYVHWRSLRRNQTTLASSHTVSSIRGLFPAAAYAFSFRIQVSFNGSAMIINFAGWVSCLGVPVGSSRRLSLPNICQIAANNYAPTELLAIPVAWATAVDAIVVIRHSQYDWGCVVWFPMFCLYKIAWLSIKHEVCFLRNCSKAFFVRIDLK